MLMYEIRIHEQKKTGGAGERKKRAHTKNVLYNNNTNIFILCTYVAYYQLHFFVDLLH